VSAILRALELADPDRHEAAELVGWLDALSSSVVTLRSAPRLSELADRALGRIDAAGTVTQRVRARAAVARALGATNVFTRAHALLDDALVVSADDPEGRRSVFRADMEISARLGDFARGLRAMKELDDVTVSEDWQELVDASFVLSVGGELERALVALARAETLRDQNDPIASAVWHKQLGLAYLVACDFVSAAPICTRAAELASAVGLRYEVGSNLHNLGHAKLRLGEVSEARAALSESLEIAAASGHERLVRMDRAYLAYLDGLEGDPEARAYLEGHLAGAEASGYLTELIESGWLLASLLKHCGEHAEARGRFEQLLVLAKRLGYRFVELEALEALRDL
jgi:tetratricopeptide (TPR) repeat protein